jgi:hypothetical protein
MSIADAAPALLPWLLIAGFWIFILWVTWSAVAAIQGMRTDIKRVADRIDRLVEDIGETSNGPGQ